MKKILISTIFWGEDYFHKLTLYNLPSLLFLKDNDQSLNIDVQFITTEKLKVKLNSWIEDQQFINLFKFKIIALEALEKNIKPLPNSFNIEKYNLLSKYQNYFLKVSSEFDLHIINYPDFFWSNESLKSIIDIMSKNNVSSLIGFSVPVNASSFLDALKLNNNSSYKIDKKALVSLSINNLHKEVLIRNWKNNLISKYPSYLVSKLGKNGILIKTFHKHVIAMKPYLCKKNIKSGFKHGTIDNDFANKLEMETNSQTLINTKLFAFVSLHETNASSLYLGRKSKDEVLKSFIYNNCTLNQYDQFHNSFKFSLNTEKNFHLNEEKAFNNYVKNLGIKRGDLKKIIKIKKIKYKFYIPRIFNELLVRIKILLKNLLISFFLRV